MIPHVTNLKPAPGSLAVWCTKAILSFIWKDISRQESTLRPAYSRYLEAPNNLEPKLRQKFGHYAIDLHKFRSKDSFRTVDWTGPLCER